jgi:hypothetical protein
MKFRDFILVTCNMSVQGAANDPNMTRTKGFGVGFF